MAPLFIKMATSMTKRLKFTRVCSLDLSRKEPRSNGRKVANTLIIYDALCGVYVLHLLKLSEKYCEAGIVGPQITLL